MRISLLVSLLLLGCTGEPASSDPEECESASLWDGSDVCDLAECEDVNDTYQAVQSANRSCTDNTDCVATPGTWYFDCACGGVTNNDAEADTTTLRARWDAMSCNDTVSDESACDCVPNDAAECSDEGVCVAVWSE